MNEKIIIQLFVLDDDEAMRLIIKDVLENADLGPFKMFSDHEVFLNEFDKHVHIAIVDHRLDGFMTGLDVVDIIKSVNRLCQIIVITGIESVSIWDAYMDKGVKKVIYKDDEVFVGKLLVSLNEAYKFWDDWLTELTDDQEKLDSVKFIRDAKPDMGLHN